ncbi:Pyrimidine/purine nucleoside phosphorylase [Candidatus Methylobacter favarea]|uniref:Pyrimidine/purine nucleoside phosphorylase n=1 Tax=Candidatus Methylobacter favarea TaxID=2707345 RepID=A0A8S0Y8X2_9GAMM|nr:pyrimidine/purine nucleoside phosphorylase [Candidatus Methylobacter favarea]CAA9889406.1 Pyrimidine/purine nucleoside phosphorylase [Candidatus Methylobacter favarea]
MSEFNNVSVIRKVNIYFNGNVSSRMLHLGDGTLKKLGFMLFDDYMFNTADKEAIKMINADLDVLLPEAEQWQSIKTGEFFKLPANAKFTVKAKPPADYCCSA